MPVLLDGDLASLARRERSSSHSVNGVLGLRAESLHIGLINNMPNGALAATERQFIKLLDSASGELPIRLSLYALPDVPRTETERSHINRYYSWVGDLGDCQIDGLIVTGTEPRAANLKDEPYWGSFTKVLEWANCNTSSTIWSCLAAHGVLQHMNGIHRRRLSDKCFGVQQCAVVSETGLTAGLPSLYPTPHSRWNDIAEDELTSCGYRILTRTKSGSVDSFVKQSKSLFVFFQGHPEYDANSLLLEYRRDIGRYLRGERNSYPSMPEGYFDRDATDALSELRERALSSRREELLAGFPTAFAEQRITNAWHCAATSIYSNWLRYLSTEKERRLEIRRRRSARGRENGWPKSLAVGAAGDADYGD